MNFFPVVERELRVAARRPSSFRLRMLVACVTSFGAAGIILLSVFTSAVRVGDFVFSALVGFAFLFCLFEGVRVAADVLSEEKREGTLGLLFLTTLRSFDIVVGKLAAVSIRSLQGLLAFLPVLSVAVILGGVTGGEFWRAALVLLNTLFFSLCVGIFVSSISREAHSALLVSLGLIFGLATVPFLLQEVLSWIRSIGPNTISTMSPAAAIDLLQDTNYRTGPDQFWRAVWLPHLASWGFLVAAILILPRTWEDKQRAPSDKPVSRRRRQVTDFASRSQKLDANPMYWLLYRGQAHWFLVTCYLAVAIIGLAFAWIFNLNNYWFSPHISLGLAFGLAWLLKLWVASYASVKLAEARRTGALELLLVTPVTADDVVKGQGLALSRAFAYPAGAALLVQIIAAIALVLENKPGGGGLFAILWTTSMAAFGVATFVMDLLALYYVGTWLAVTQGKPLQAFFKTVLYVLILPVVIFCIPTVAIDAGLIGWARYQLKKNFRRTVAEQYAKVYHAGRSERPRFHHDRPGVPPIIVRSA